ncbi:signal peptidase I [Trichococcus collinsii]|uniref:Signal peptidase I n=1 Tax=Trichococcus collinsii TaxID=157076 RepID=A0AB37ZXS0_9LACT|nr:signal peptidase I [Trichococcus collinsii]CZQ83061.1 peptidase s26a signal peptidase i serine active site [Trichococcus collinsii]SDZ85779.1 signal peptidase I [Trichococcus collinsii]
MSFGNKNHDDQDSGFVSRNERFGVDQKKEIQPENRGSFLREAMSLILSVAIAFVLFLVIRTYLFYPFQVVGDSMVPTLETGDRLILNKLAEIDRFDIVVFPAPDGTDEEYVKRIIGLPGDEITYFQDELYINGKKIEEHYLEALREDSDQALTGDFTLFSLTGEATVPEDMYFVLGDNRNVSKDSRVFGFIPAAEIEGTADLRLWPLNKIGIIDDNGAEE